jgi:hypothetical protein
METPLLRLCHDAVIAVSRHDSLFGYSGEGEATMVLQLVLTAWD